MCFSFLFINFNRYLWHFNDDCCLDKTCICRVWWNGAFERKKERRKNKWCRPMLKTANSMLIKKMEMLRNQKLIIIVSILLLQQYSYSNAHWKWLLLFHLLYLYLAVYSFANDERNEEKNSIVKWIVIIVLLKFVLLYFYCFKCKNRMRIYILRKREKKIAIRIGFFLFPTRFLATVKQYVFHLVSLQASIWNDG